jgi:hypothetical protein
MVLPENRLPSIPMDYQWILRIIFVMVVWVH